MSKKESRPVWAVFLCVSTFLVLKTLDTINVNWYNDYSTKIPKYERGIKAVILKAGSTTFAVKISSTESGHMVYVIDDLDQGMSVTNNAAAVIRSIAHELGEIPDHSLVIYRDTDGQYDGLGVQGGCFVDFYPLGTISENEAISMAAAAADKREEYRDITGIELTPSEHGKDCLGNGQHEGVECCCDECNFYLSCFPGYDIKQN